MPTVSFVHRFGNNNPLTACKTPKDPTRLRQIRDLITSPVWGCLNEQQQHRWLDQFQELAR